MVRSVLALAENRLRLEAVPLDRGTRSPEELVLEVLSGTAFRRKRALGADVTPAPRPWPPQLP
jgi:hypothetical protein